MSFLETMIMKKTSKTRKYLYVLYLKAPINLSRWMDQFRSYHLLQQCSMNAISLTFLFFWRWICFVVADTDPLINSCKLTLLS